MSSRPGSAAADPAPTVPQPVPPVTPPNQDRRDEATPEGAVSRTVTVAHPDGLHLRPITRLSQLAATLPAPVTLTKGAAAAEATSMMGLMTLGAACGDEITLTARGRGAAESVAAVAELLTRPD